ncbi:Nuclear porin [Plasmopara halstedii]|uniref:Nuclear porin n=1 Tax=Plasmopara halstedii TaxID=4781 RepID=A0A0P1AZU3_PLAHL|nr:Nuclear porin [Plasmopara halstedii]CEG47420.1 Nuclear porin [Plasmopara halstedii]|eukprot:XP_024583789.1 Nuclear porin [Plasmopara halstedii]
MSFNFGASSTAPSGGFNFGASSSTTSTSSTAPSTGGFSFGSTSDAPTTSTAPSTGFSFGSKPTAAAPPTSFSFASTFSTPAAPAEAKTSAPSTGFNFGSTDTTSTAPSTSTSTAPSTSTSGFNFGAVSTSTEAKTSAPATSSFSFGSVPITTPDKAVAPASSSGFNFNAPDISKPAETKPAATGFSFGSNAAPSTTSAPTSGFSFGNITKSTDKADESKTETSKAPAFGFGPSTAASSSTDSTATSSTAITTTVTGTMKPPAEYMGRTIEDIINAWSEQLERNTDTFTTEAVKVSKWDSDLMDSQRKLGDLAIDVRRIQVAQNELDTNLDTIFAYQMELKSTLEQLEHSVDKMYESQDQMPVAADIEREQTLQLSVDIDGQLNSMTTTLKEIVERLNKAQDEVADESNPIVQIMKVLNVHHNSLQWIESSADQINNEIGQLSRKLQESSI